MAFDNQEHIDNTIKLNYEPLKMVADYFDSINKNYAVPNANFLFVNLEVDSRMIVDKLQRKRIIIRPGFLWKKDSFIRISTGIIEETQIFIDVLKEIL